MAWNQIDYKRVPQEQWVFQTPPASREAQVSSSSNQQVAPGAPYIRAGYTYFAQASPNEGSRRSYSEINELDEVMESPQSDEDRVKIKQLEFKTKELRDKSVLICRERIQYEDLVSDWSEKIEKLSDEINQIQKGNELLQEHASLIEANREHEACERLKDPIKRLLVQTKSFKRKIGGDNSSKYFNLMKAIRKRDLMKMFLEAVKKSNKLRGEVNFDDYISERYRKLFKKEDVERLNEVMMQYDDDSLISEREYAEMVLSTTELKLRGWWIRLFKDQFNRDPYEVLKEYLVDEENI